MTIKNESHYYACSAFNWAVAPTRQEAITKLAKDIGADMLKRQVKAVGGLYVRSCEVLLPISAAYDIKDHKPVGVATAHPRGCRVVNVAGASMFLD